MSTTIAKNCPCPSPELVAIPGTPGAAGSAGAAGSNGANSFSVLSTASFTIPAVASDTINLTFGDAQWMVVGQNVFVEGAGYFSVKSKTGTTQAILTYLNYVGNNNAGNNISAGAKVSPAGTQPTVTFPIGISQGGTGSSTTKYAAATALGLGQAIPNPIALEAVGFSLADQAGTYVSTATTITGTVSTATAAGLYLIQARCSLDYFAASFATANAGKGAKITVLVKRTNNTVGTLATTYRYTGLITTSTFPSVDIVVPAFSVSLALNDVIELEILIDANATAGKVLVNSSCLVLIPLALT